MLIADLRSRVNVSRLSQNTISSGEDWSDQLVTSVGEDSSDQPTSLELEGAGIQPIVRTFLRNKLLVISALNYLTVIKYHDHIRIADS